VPVREEGKVSRLRQAFIGDRVRGFTLEFGVCCEETRHLLLILFRFEGTRGVN
jgi:hypothetical protein